MKKTIYLAFPVILFGLFSIYNSNKLSDAKPISDFYTNGQKPPANCGRFPASTRTDIDNNITIPYGQVAYITENIDADTITINGELHCNEAGANPEVLISAKTIIVNGLLKCGSQSNPYNKKLIISLKHSSINPVTNPAYRGLLVHGGGRLELFGERGKSGWVKLDETANVGDESILVTAKPKFTKRVGFSEQRRNRAWEVGDEIVIGPTGFNYEEAESFIVTGIDSNNPNRLYLNHPVEFQHWGEKKAYSSPVLGNINFDERAEVANLTRSIVIQADEFDFEIDESDAPEAQRGGHVMVHHSSEAYIDNVEFYKMGQAGVMARYPFHWHYVGDATDQYIKNSSVHHSYQRCITVHRTQNTRVQNNVCYDFKGHGYFLEDGNETGNKITHNLAVMAKAPDASKVLLASDNIIDDEYQGRFPSVSGFWISNPDNYVVGNVVSGSIGSGLWMAFEREVHDNAGNVVARPLTTATDTFNYNSAHATQVGITWDGAPDGGLVGNPNNPNDRKLINAHYNPPVTPTFRGLIAYKNYLTGIYFRGQTAIYDKSIVADNGRSYWVAYNQIVKNSIFIGETENKSALIDEDFYNKTNSNRYRKGGMTLYDGPFEIHNSDFLDFSTSASTYTLDNGNVVNSTVIPFTPTGGTSKYTNFVSGLRFSPEPIYRAHLEDPDVKGERSYLNFSRIRDLDGSLSGTGRNSIIVGKRSLGYSASSNCMDPGESLHNYMVCPSSYTESSLDFMRWGGDSNPWKTPFVVMREDGKTIYPISEWNYIKNHPNSTFSLANSETLMYKLLPKYEYAEDVAAGTSARLEANAEVENAQIPIVEIVAYGRNCQLGDGAVEVSSLIALRNQEVSSYYSRGEKFYVKVVPEERWRMLGDDPQIRATAYSTATRLPITCDQNMLGDKAFGVPVRKRVIGHVDNIKRETTTTTVSGWACNYSHDQSIHVKVFAHKKYFKAKSPKKKVLATAPILLGEGYSFRDKNEALGMKCGALFGAGRKFEIVLQNTDLSSLKDYKFYVQGISNSGGSNRYLKGSGVHDVIQTRLTTRK